MINFISEKSDVRLDVFLSEILPEFSRSKFQQIIKNGFVKINSKKEKPSYLVQKGDKIEIEIPEKKEIEILSEKIKLDIKYEDDDILVINKPKNMLTHPTEQETSGTLVNALLHNFKTLSDINCTNVFLGQFLKAIEVKAKRNKWNLIKLSSFCTAKEIINKMKRYTIY